MRPQDAAVTIDFDHNKMRPRTTKRALVYWYEAVTIDFDALNWGPAQKRGHWYTGMVYWYIGMVYWYIGMVYWYI